MLEGLYTAAAGMDAQQAHLDAVANDLANSQTTGYKSVRVAFRDLVYNAGAVGALPDVGIGAGAAASMIGRNQSQGALKTTDQPLDVAVIGPGYIQVKKADGTVGLTRDGELRVDSAGRVGTHMGFLLEPPVTVPRGTDASVLKITPDGSVQAAGKQIGRVTLVTVKATDKLNGGGDNVFTATPESGPIVRAAAGTTLQQGVLESSNVDTASALTDMIEAQRTFEMASKAVQTQDQVLEIANQVKR